MKSYLGVVLVVLFVLAVSPIHAAGIVGTGTASTCTEAALDAALVGGGTITFNCGAGNHTIHISGSKTIREDTIIDGGNRITLDGGNFTQIFYNSGTEFEVRNMTIRNARSIQGSAIFNDAGVLTVYNVDFRGNVAVTPGPANDTSGGRGGAIYNSGGDMFISTSRFLGNRADNYGGAIFTTGGQVRITRSNFVLNASLSLNAHGGAVASGSPSEAGSILSIAETAFNLNVTELVGGAIFSNNEEIIIRDSHFGLNTANVGAAIGAQSNSEETAYNIDISFTDFENNTARYGGGALNIVGQPLIIAQSSFVRNRALRRMAGAIYVGGGYFAQISDSTFQSNVARQEGGAIFNESMEFSVLNSTFVSNSASDGGAIYNVGTLDLSRSRRLIRNSTFSANRAGRGGAIFDAPSASGGSAHSGAYATQVEYSTFAYNTASVSDAGSAIYGVSSALVLRATILAYGDSAACSVRFGDVYSVIEFPSAASCGGTIGRDPLLEPLADNGGFTLTHALQDPSPAIDAVVAPLILGTGSASDPLRCTVDNDQRYHVRPFNARGLAHAVCDIGAYEYLAGAATSIIFPLLSSTPEPTLVPVPTLIPVIVNCTPFRATSPLGGLPNGFATFYWDAAPGATSYNVNVINEQGQQVASFSVNAPSTTLGGDVSFNTIGGGTNFTWVVQALHNGIVYCSREVTIPRESPNIPPPPQPTSVPACGNGIQEPGETPNSCPNGY